MIEPARTMHVERTRHAAKFPGAPLDEETVPLVLSLLDQVYSLRRQMNALTSAIQRQPEDTRRAILDLLDDPRRSDGRMG